ncbi:golgin subfamily A member 6-like protein 1 [Salvia divinorum]|uniref:Golgin subfamily A member 6-like protein 1 n=1 Tax=Salvia divinorum TaxID=28513 RepID=A0ABD1GAB4_SALDI
MARKKVSNASHQKPSQNHDETVKSNSMDSPPPSSVDSEKLENLKSLNQMLLKEAVERRQQVDSLLQSKGSLEMELSRSSSDKEALGSELAQLVDRVAELELERRVLAVYVAVQVGVEGEEFVREMKGLEMEMREKEKEVEERASSIARLNAALSESHGALGAEREASRRVQVERDVFEAKLNRQIEEDLGLRTNLAELGDKIRDFERDIEESRTAYNAVVNEREGMATRIKLLVEEKDFTVRDLMESNKLIEKMKDEISVIVKEKEEVEKEKNREIGKRRELENVVTGINDMVADLKQEEASLQKIVAELDKKCAEGETKLSEMWRETDRLVGEMKLSEKRIKELADEKGVIEKELNDALKNLAERSLELEGLANEKFVILEEKSCVEGQVRELGSHIDELRAAVVELEESNVAYVEKIRSLESQVGEYKSKLEKFYVEREGVERCLDEEKQNALKLNAKIEELEKRIEKSHKASGELKTEKAAILSEKMELESRFGILREEIASLQETMAKLRAEFDSMKSKAETADANSVLVLNMLKGTSAFCSKEECEGEVGNIHVNGEALKVHAVEMETIKNAFKSKAAKMEEMKRQLVVLRSSVMDEQKKKSFWTMLSSVTTLLAALSLAYVARGH